MGQTGGHEGERGAAMQPALLITRGHEGCTECWACIRHCPAKALRVEDGRALVIEQRCVKCGACVTVCTQSTHRVRDDLPRVRELLAGPLPVVALLASEHTAALHPNELAEVERALLERGFASVETTVLGEELVAAAYEQVQAASPAGLPRLRSTCPVAVSWVRRFHPQLTGALVPVVPPYVAHARLVRAVNTREVAVVYVSPCWARKDEALEPATGGEVDVAIGFDELRRLIDETPSEGSRAPARTRRRATKQLSATDGFPRRVLAQSTLADRDLLIARGLDEIDRALTAIERGEVAPSVVDMLCCEGCIDGPCVSPELSVFAKRNIDAAQRESQLPPPVNPRDVLAALPHIELRRSFSPQPAPVREPTDQEIDAVLAAGEFASRAEAIDCGACGHATCVEHAVAIWLGNSSWSLCFPLERKRLMREREHLSEASNTDPLTGLLNRRAFDEHFAQEIARAERYHSALSLVVLDLDHFKEVNDGQGHAAGDALLRAVGVLLRSELRTADRAVRLGGDEFALLLPGTSKTDAWAVAEKVRAGIRGMAAVVAEDESPAPREPSSGPHHARREVGATCSVGVASFGETHVTTAQMLEAADEALYAAKRAGRDRVELAAG